MFKKTKYVITMSMMITDNIFKLHFQNALFLYNIDFLKDCDVIFIRSALLVVTQNQIVFIYIKYNQIFVLRDVLVAKKHD